MTAVGEREPAARERSTRSWLRPAGCSPSAARRRSRRDVAREAGVNHGLIHHYIGSRDDLLRLVITTSMEQAQARVEGATDLAAALAALRGLGGDDTGYARLLAWALLEGYDPATLQGRSSALEAIVATADVDNREVRIGVAVAVVQTLGWKLFGDYALAAVGIDDVDGTARAEAGRTIERLLPGATADEVSS